MVTIFGMFTLDTQSQFVQVKSVRLTRYLGYHGYTFSSVGRLFDRKRHFQLELGDSGL